MVPVCIDACSPQIPPIPCNPGLNQSLKPGHMASSSELSYESFDLLVLVFDLTPIAKQYLSTTRQIKRK